MHLESIPHYRALLSDLDFFLRENPAALLLRRENEPPAEERNLSFSLPVQEKTIETVIDESLCTRCAFRIAYKPEQFSEEKPELPYLILVHNARLPKKGEYYADKSESTLFEKMIESTLGHKPGSFLVREALRCVFGSTRSDLSQEMKNCRTHIENDIINFNIKGVLVLGNAASLLVPEIAKLKEMSAKVTQFFSVPTVFSTGPERIVSMQKKNYPGEQIRQAKLTALESLKVFAGLMK